MLHWGRRLERSMMCTSGVHGRSWRMRKSRSLPRRPILPDARVKCAPLAAPEKVQTHLSSLLPPCRQKHTHFNPLPSVLLCAACLDDA